MSMKKKNPAQFFIRVALDLLIRMETIDNSAILSVLIYEHDIDISPLI